MIGTAEIIIWHIHKTPVCLKVIRQQCPGGGCGKEHNRLPLTTGHIRIRVGHLKNRRSPPRVYLNRLIECTGNSIGDDRHGAGRNLRPKSLISELKGKGINPDKVGIRRISATIFIKEAGRADR